MSETFEQEQNNESDRFGKQFVKSYAEEHYLLGLLQDDENSFRIVMFLDSGERYMFTPLLDVREVLAVRTLLNAWVEEMKK